MQLFPTEIFPSQHSDTKIVEEIDNTIKYLEETGDWSDSSYLSPYALQETYTVLTRSNIYYRCLRNILYAKLESFLSEAIEKYVGSQNYLFQIVPQHT